MFFQPWGFLLLAGAGVLAAIYFLQRRFRSRQVSSLMLWRAPRLHQQGGRKWRRLRTPPPFWLELLLILLLALAAAAPHFKLSENRRPLAVVLDDSFSMSAGSPQSSEAASETAAFPRDSPRSLAAQALSEELGQDRHAPVHLVLAGRQASLLAQGLEGEEQVLDALRRWRCQSASADLTSAMALARRLAGSLGRVLVLSDHAPGQGLPAAPEEASARSAEDGAGDRQAPQPQERLTPQDGPQETRAGAAPFVQWSFGRPRTNLALVNAGRSSVSSRNFVEVANLSDSPLRTTLTIETLPSLRLASGSAAQSAADEDPGADSADGSAEPHEASQPARGSAADGDITLSSAAGGVSQRTLDLAPGETLRLVFQADLRRPVRLSLPQDDLRADNQALLLPEDRPPVRTALQIEEPALNTLLQRTLQATGQARIVDDRPEIVFLTSRQAAQGSEAAPRAWRFHLLSERDARPQAGPFVVDRAHTLGQGLNLSAVLWAASGGPLPGTPVVLADDIPLLAVRPALDGRVDLWMRLRPEASNVQRTADWPILVHNLLSWRQDQRPGPRRSNLRSGEEVRLRLEDRSAATVVLPDASRRDLSAAAGEISLSAGQPGLYRIVSPAGPSYAVSANVLHPDESNLRQAATGRYGRWIDEAARRWEYADLAWVPLLAALLVLLIHQLLTGGHLGPPRPGAVNLHQSAASGHSRGGGS